MSPSRTRLERGVYMARLFLDYEGRHSLHSISNASRSYRINSIRVYNPIKQSKEKDSDGAFIKKWLPELSNFDVPFIHEPWKLTAFDLIDKTIPLFYKNPIISVDLKRTKTVKQL